MAAILLRLAKKGICKPALCPKAGPLAGWGRATGADHTHVWPGWLREAAHILDARLVQAAEAMVSNGTVESHLDAWRKRIARQRSDGTLWEMERYCLTEFLQVLSNLRLYLVQCNDRQHFPRMNNDKEPPLPTARNSRGFVFATNEGLLFLHLNNAGPPLCPHLFRSGHFSGSSLQKRLWQGVLLSCLCRRTKAGSRTLQERGKDHTVEQEMRSNREENAPRSQGSLSQANPSGAQCQKR